MSVKYVGRVTTFRGKRLFNILCRLKNFGVGRMVYRNSFHERYPERSYYVITRVEPDMSDPMQEHNDVRGAIPSKAWGYKVFRGQQMGETKIYSSFKPDWRLVPHDLEEHFVKYDGPERSPNIVPDEAPFPPLMERMIIEGMKNKGTGVKGPLQLKLDIRKEKWNTAISEREMGPLDLGVGQEKT